jgi:hypothetical protein
LDFYLIDVCEETKTQRTRMNKPDQVITTIEEIDELYAEFLKKELRLVEFCLPYCKYNSEGQKAREIYLDAKSALQERLYENVVVKEIEGVLE